MTELQIKQAVQRATGISELTVTEMPSDVTGQSKPRRFLIINVGPLEIDLDNAIHGLGQTHATIAAVLDTLVEEPALQGCRLGISVFAMPGGQAFRALAGSYEVRRGSRPPYRLEGAYSNVRAFRALLES